MRTAIRLALIAAFCFLGGHSFCQAPSWQWAKNATGTGGNIATSIALDAAGNAYVTGTFFTPTLSLGQVTLTSQGQDDIFLAKYDAGGTLLWAKAAGGANSDLSVSVAVDGFGHVYIAGYFYSPSLIFGPDTIYNGGANDLFIAKYDTSGNALWAASAGTTGFDAAGGITTDDAGNAYLAGGFTSPSISFGSVTLSHAGITSDIFLAKYDSSGHVQWVRSAGSTDNDMANSVSTDHDGNVYVGGSFGGTDIGFGGTTLQNVVSSAGWGYADAFLAKYDGNGNVIWAKSIGSLWTDVVTAVAVDGSGHPYIAGRFEGPTIDIGGTVLTNKDGQNGSADVFLARYDSSGALLWAQGAGGSLDENLLSMSLDTAGNPCIAGYFESPDLTIGSDTLVTAGMSDMFLSKYDVNGNELWALRAGGTNEDGVLGTAADASGNLWIAGGSQSPSLSFGATALSADAAGDAIIAKTGVSSTGIAHSPSATSLLLYPNPAGEELTIVLPEKAKVNITSTDGQLVRCVQTSQLKTDINLRGLSSGVYIIQATMGNGGKLVRRFLKL